VRPSNLAAIRLYQRLGFEQIGIRRGYYQAPDGREDAIVLKLELRTAG
jgi:ribosomal-protein-alanine N-acetyltransferase